MTRHARTCSGYREDSPLQEVDLTVREADNKTGEFPWTDPGSGPKRGGDTEFLEAPHFHLGKFDILGLQRMTRGKGGGWQKTSLLGRCPVGPGSAARFGE